MKIEFVLTAKQVTVIERIARAKNTSVPELLEKVIDKAIILIKDMRSSSAQDGEIERDLRKLAAMRGVNVEVFKDDLLNPKKAAKRVFDPEALRIFQLYIKKQRLIA